MRPPRAAALALASLALASALLLTSQARAGEEPWKPPAGIPAPRFGITQRAGTASWVIDRSHALATDEDNPRGTRDRPRKTIPDLQGLAPGDVVEIGPGRYAAGRGVIRINGRGTSEKPIFIRGVSSTARPVIEARIEVYGGGGATYMVLENLELDHGGRKEPALEIVARTEAPVDHIAVRRCEMHRGGGVRIYSQGGGVARDIVLQHDSIHDNGDWRAGYDEDVHGVVVGGASERVWILECELYHNSGDGVQVNPGRFQTSESVKSVYAGRNLCYENKQTGLWTKQAQDVIFSENVIRDHQPVGKNPSAWGSAMGYQYGPDRVWFIFNRISNCAFGITGFSTESEGGRERIYCVGNVIRRIHHAPALPYRGEDPWSNAAIMLASGSKKYIVNNTIFDVDGGIHLPRTGEVHILNNIVAGVREGSHVALEGPLGRGSQQRGNIFEGEERLRWDGKPAALRVKAAFSWPGGSGVGGNGGSGSSGAPWQGTPPLFVDASAGDLRLCNKSAAIDRGVESDVYDTFASFYGIDIRVDAAGRPRPLGSGFDCGAFERDPGE